MSFLHELWSTKPDGTAIQLWRKSDSKTFTFQAIEPAESWVRTNGGFCDVYMAAGLAGKVSPKPTKQRANARSVVGIAGVWADVDINGGPQRKTGAARSRADAHNLCESLALPTMVLSSGYGLQAWWLFEDGVWPFYTEEDRDSAAKMVAGFQGALRAEAKKRGYTIDSTFDLARLMRVPESYNHKSTDAPAAVELLDDGGPRHSRASLEALGLSHRSNNGSSLQLISGEGIDIELRLDASPPLTKLDLLRDVDDDFRAVWERKASTRTRDWSTSEYEFSLTNYFVAADWTDQEICDALVYYRNRYEPGDPKGKNRADRIAQTIGKVRATTNHDQQRTKSTADREEAVDQLVAISEEGGLDPVVTLGLFNRVLGGPEVKELIQYGRDPDTCRYALTLANGDEVPLGAVENLINQDKFRQRFMVVTRYLPKRIAKVSKWDEIVQALVAAAQVREDVEDTRSHRAWEWVQSYVERRYSTDKDLACQVNEPFTQSGYIFVPLGPLHQYLRRIRGERIADVDLRQYLEAAGFERKTVNYNRDDGKRSTRSYFKAPWEAK